MRIISTLGTEVHYRAYTLTPETLKVIKHQCPAKENMFINDVPPVQSQYQPPVGPREQQRGELQTAESLHTYSSQPARSPQQRLGKLVLIQLLRGLHVKDSSYSRKYCNGTGWEESVGPLLAMAPCITLTTLPHNAGRSLPEESSVAHSIARQVQVRIPATSANLGCGFDILGLALQLYNFFTLTTTPEPGWRVSLPPGIDLPTHRDNLVYQAARRLFEHVGIVPPGLHLSLTIDIPLARGLGSSSSAIVGGLVAA